jgi:hypothetical protein
VAHAPLPYYSTPDYVASPMPAVADSAPVDLVFVDFIEADVITLLNTAQSAKKYTTGDVKSYSDLLISDVLPVYAEIAWK